MDALRILNRIDAVGDVGPVRDLLVLILQRVGELLAIPESAEHLPKANVADGAACAVQPSGRGRNRRANAT
jgi:hypothetical protein